MSTSASKSSTIWQKFAFALSLSLACAATQAAPVTFTGSVSDCSNPALIGSGADLPAPSCATDQDKANNVAVYELIVPFGGFTDFNFGGFSDIDFTPFFQSAPAATGLQPYLSIFLGTGDSAVFVTSSQDGPVVPRANPGDLRVFLAAGTYSVAISNLTNRANAESEGGTLGDGFTGRGDPQFLGNGSYQLTATVPEPESTWLAAIGIAALLLGRHRRQRQRASASTID